MKTVIFLIVEFLLASVLQYTFNSHSLKRRLRSSCMIGA